MKSSKALILVVAVAWVVAIGTNCVGQTTQLYQQMTSSQRADFVSAKAKDIGRRISDSEYEFTPSFETEIQLSLDTYVQRLANPKGGGPLLTMTRAQAHAPTIMTAFKARGVSPLIGLYIPWIESDYINLASPAESGSVGLFQFIPQTGMRLGLTPDDLLNVEKSADAAARYLAINIKMFEKDDMKEALALLAYNRGENNVQSDVARLVNKKNKSCSICALTEQRDKLDKSFNSESVYYVPRFFAAAILGENPQAFGLSSPPLSSFGTGH